MNSTRRTKILVGAMTVIGLGAAGYAGFASHTPHKLLALAVLALAAATSRMRVKLPGINGTMSVNLPFLLTAIVNLSAAEAVLITVASTVVQCWPRKNTRFNPQQLDFNLSMMAFASSAASLIFHATAHSVVLWHSTTIGLVLATLTMFVGQTIPVAGIVAVSEGKSIKQVWLSVAHLSFPYYVIGAGVTSILQAIPSHPAWGLALAAFPVMFVIHRSYRAYFSAMAEALHQALAKAASAGA